jgi:hypothetical protein
MARGHSNQLLNTKKEKKLKKILVAVADWWELVSDGGERRRV